MTENTQPEAGSTHIIHYALEMGLLWIDGDGRDKVREALDALDTLEAQLEAIGASAGSEPEALHHTKYLTVVYRDIKPGDEARELIMHPKMTASSWSHVMNERDRLQDENANLNAGYAAARLEIESLQARIKTMAEEHADELMVAHLDGRMRAAQPAGAQQPGVVYAALPGQGVPFYSDDALRMVRASELRAFADATCALRASHGQAPAQAAPAAVAGPSEAVAYLDIGAGGYLDLGTDLSNEALSRLPKGRHALVIAGTYGIDGYTAAPNTQPAPDEILNMAREQGLPETETEGVFRVNVDDLGRMFAADRAARAPADSVLEAAACWPWIAEYLVGTRTDLDDGIVASETVNDLRKLVDAARKQGGAA